MKLPEWVLDFYVHNMVNIDEVEFGFVPGRGTTDGISIVCQLQENYVAINESLCFAFDDLEKGLRSYAKKGAVVDSEEPWCWGIGCVCYPDMHPNAHSHVRVNGQYSEEFGMDVGVHLSFVLRPFSSSWCWKRFRASSGLVSWEPLYADGLVLIADTLEEWISAVRLGPSTTDQRLKWTMTAPCIMRRSHSNIWVMCYTLVRALTVPLLPNVAWPRESSRNSYPCSLPCTSSATRDTQPVSVWLCSMVETFGNQMLLTWTG